MLAVILILLLALSGRGQHATGHRERPTPGGVVLPQQ